VAGTASRPGIVSGSAPILLVEDDVQLRQFIQWTLEDEGLVVETAADGQQAVDQATQRRPALVILDWGLPRLNGDEVAARLRAAYACTVPILLISAAGSVAEKARQIHAVDYLPKPFDIDDLLTAVHRALGTP
jgi:two-component system phosphate regulon response regulator PhoB